MSLRQAAWLVDSHRVFPGLRAVYWIYGFEARSRHVHLDREDMGSPQQGCGALRTPQIAKPEQERDSENHSSPKAVSCERSIDVGGS